MLKKFSRSNQIEIGKGKLVGYNGPGSLYVNTEGDSYIISAVDSWYKNGIGIDKSEFEIKDIRLNKLLGVSRFYEVPTHKIKNKNNGTNHDIKIPIYRFPLLHYCKSCENFKTLKPDNFKKKAYCKFCEDQREFLQFPIVIVCEHGHISDFPYLDFVHNNSASKEYNDHKVKLIRKGQSILDWGLKCSCGAFKWLHGITGTTSSDEYTPFQKEMGGISCKGERPWTENNVKDECSAKPAAILKNALNTYQPETIQALIITDYENENNKSLDNIYEEEFDRLSLKIKEEDYEKLKVEVASKGTNHSIIKSVNAVSRLEELLVQTGFHRLSQADEEESILKVHGNENFNVLFNENKKYGWYPAKKQFGEGIFIEFNETILGEWENNHAVNMRFESQKKRTEEFYLQNKFNTASSVLIHTLSHSLIREFSLHSGYSISSIREKLYLNESKKGLLIYVTDSDKDGTYGGLVRLSHEEIFKKLFNNALRELSWCSSDPVCYEIGKEMGQGINNSNSSACHNCNYVPSTSCSYRNCFLDRDFVGREDAIENISNYFGWFEDKKLDKLDFNYDSLTSFIYNYWEEVPSCIENSPEVFIKDGLGVPTYFDSFIKINNKSYKFKYLWKKEKRIIFENSETSKLNLKLPLIIDGWLITEV